MAGISGRKLLATSNVANNLLEVGSLADTRWIKDREQNDILALDTSIGKWVNKSLGQVGVPQTINDLTDTNIPTPTDGQTIIWDNATSKWVATNGGAVATGLGGLSDVHADASNTPPDSSSIIYDTPTTSWIVLPHTEYVLYVNASTGSDTNVGTIGAPLETVSPALNKIFMRGSNIGCTIKLIGNTVLLAANHSDIRAYNIKGI